MLATNLVCDGDPVVRSLLVEALGEESYALHEAKKGQESVELARSLRPDVVVLDMVMPGCSGLDVLEELRCNPHVTDTRVVLCTATHTLDGDAVGNLGADGYLQKPFSTSQLVSVVDELLADR